MKVKSAIILTIITLLAPQQAIAQSILSRILGSSATLTLDMSKNLVQGKKTPITVNIIAKEYLKPQNIYIQLQCSETIKIENYTFLSESKDKKEKRIRVHQSEIVMNRVLHIAENTHLKQNSLQTIKGEITVPKTSPITTKGKYFHIACQATAGLSLEGNDPDSGWMHVEIRQN